jgi:hypothetical protein
MRVLKRHSDRDAVTDSDDAVETERPAPSETSASTPTTERQPVVADEVEPARPGVFQRFRRTATVPLTVPQRAVRQTVTVPGRRVETTTPERAWSPAAILATIAGAALAVVGVITLIRTGVNETWYRPVTEVLDANHTPLLGGIEVGAGVLLLLLGLSGSRFLVAAAGIAGALLATAAAVEPEELTRELAIERWWAWALAAAGVVLTLAAIYEPRAKGRGDTVIDVR